MNFTELFINREKDMIFIWICNIGAEKSWYPINNIGFSNNIEFTDTIGEINLLLCRSQDYIILRKKPNEEFFEYAKNWGISKPQVLIPKTREEKQDISNLILNDIELLCELKKLQGDKVYLVPYAVTSEMETISIITGLKILGTTSVISRQMNDKAFMRSISEKLCFNVPHGRTLYNKGELKNYMEAVDWNTKHIIKYPYGASGEGQFIVNNKSQIKTVEMFFKKKGIGYPLIIEQWYDNKVDINFQIFIAESGLVELISINQQLVNGTVYGGSNYPSNLSNAFLERYKLYALQIGKKMFEYGYYGIVSIDSLIIDDQWVIPLLDVNARFSLSTYFSWLYRKENYVAFRQYDIYVNNIFSYGELVKRMECICSDNTQVLVCAPSLLPSLTYKIKDKYYGRIMILIKSKKQEDIVRCENRIKSEINKIQNYKIGI